MPDPGRRRDRTGAQVIQVRAVEGPDLARCDVEQCRPPSGDGCVGDLAIRQPAPPGHGFAGLQVSQGRIRIWPMRPAPEWRDGSDGGVEDPDRMNWPRSRRSASRTPPSAAASRPWPGQPSGGGKSSRFCTRFCNTYVPDSAIDLCPNRKWRTRLSRERDLSTSRGCAVLRKLGEFHSVPLHMDRGVASGHQSECLVVRRCRWRRPRESCPILTCRLG